MVYDMKRITIQGAFGGREKLKLYLPEEIEILEVIDMSPLWKPHTNVMYIAAQRFKVYFRYDKNNPPNWKGGE